MGAPTQAQSITKQQEVYNISNQIVALIQSLIMMVNQIYTMWIVPTAQTDAEKQCIIKDLKTAEGLIKSAAERIVCQLRMPRY